MKSFNAFLIVYLLWSSTALTQNFDQVEITTQHVRNNIYMLFGAGGNIGVLQGEGGFVIVDDQFEPLADKILAALAEISDEGVAYAINTHFHFDHTDGNKAFGAKGATIIAHRNVRKRLSENLLIEVPGFDTLVQEVYPSHGLPTIVFKESLGLHTNEETVRIFHVDSAHTDTDAIIFFENSNVMHTGDVFVRYGIPFIDRRNGGSVGGMIRAVNKLLDLCDDDTLLIPGHGELSTKTDLIRYRDMLQEIWDRTGLQVSQGKSQAEVLDSKPARGFPGEMTADYIVMMILEEMSGN